jgi:hypothetical protein
LGALGGLLDEGFCFLLRRFELLDVAVEFAHVLADEGVAFALLCEGQRVASPLLISWSDWVPAPLAWASTGDL